MILVQILIGTCIFLAILIVGMVIGSVLRRRRINRENKLMETILKRYGKDKTTRTTGRAREHGDGGGDISHRL